MCTVYCIYSCSHSKVQCVCVDYGESIDKPKPGSREGPFNVFAPAAATLVLRYSTWCSVLVESATRHLNANKSRIVSF